MRDEAFINKHEEQCKEVIQYIIEYLIYGDKHDSNIFDVFCEYNLMNEFIYLAVLILNLTNTTTLYYIFSNNFINQIISNDYDKYDEDFLSYYVNFVKSLSLKIDKTTIQFFFNEQVNSFPLLQSALKLYNHTDPMIKNVVRNIILTILKPCRLRDLIIKLNDQISSNDQESINNIHDDIIDDILYLQDIFGLNLDKINFILINCLFYYMILPLLCRSLVSMTKPKITIPVSLLMLLTLFHYIKNECFLNLIFTVLFKENLNKKILKYIEDYPQNARNYFYDWNSQKKSHNPSFTTYISNNYSESFLKSLIYQNHSPYPEILAIIKKYDILSEQIEINSQTFTKNLLEDVISKFSNSEFDNMTSYHKHISIATGINVGLTLRDNGEDCFIKTVEKMFSNYDKENLKNEISTSKNECRGNLYSYLMSKDDSLILMVSLLIYTIHKKNINHDLLSRAKLLKANYLPKSEYDTNRILNEIFFFDDFESINDNNDTKKMINNSNLNNITSYSNDEANENNSRKNSLQKNSLPIDIGFNENTNTNSSKLNTLSPLDLSDSTGENIINLDKIQLILKHDDTNMVNQYHQIRENAKFTLLDNSYFLNLPSNEVNETNQKLYDPDLVENLLNLINVEPPFRIITNRIILENISSLLIKDEDFNFVDRNQLDIINKTYYSYLSKIKLLIIQNKFIRETGFELFEIEWKKYRFDLSKIVEELISRPYILIPFNFESKIEGTILNEPIGYPQILLMPKTEVDSFKVYLNLFMTIHDLRNKIYKEKEIIKNSFPLSLGGNDFEIEQHLNLSNMGLETYQCKLKIQNKKSFSSCVVIIYQNYLYLAQSDLKDSSFVVIKYKFPLRHLEAQQDRSDSKHLNLIVKDKNAYMDIGLFFEEASQSTNVKKSFDEQRTSSCNTEYILLDSYFDELINKWNF